MFAACLLAFCTGFLSLSLEILWIRLFSFTNFSLPQAFAFVLVFYLLGIAFGASFGKRFCKVNTNLYAISGVILLIASATSVFFPWLYAQYAHTGFQVKFGGLLIFLTAFLTAIIFPIVHYIGATPTQSKVGQAISRVYVANILGATLGPIFTGMFLLSVCTTQQSFILCAVFAFVAAMFCLLATIRAFAWAASTLSGLVMLGVMLTLNGHYLIAKVAVGGMSIRRVVENQNGIVVTYSDSKLGDLVSGGNVYDGRTNLDPIINSNGINRILIMAALQNKPERVLMIGLSIGSWLKLLTSFPGIKNIDVIEINPGYLQAIQDYPRQNSALSDPRVHLYIDDGRRWLKLHPENKYDLVIMNTTYHWRAYITNLLSSEFLQTIKQHMQPNAVLAYNSTNSPDVLKTATTLFKEAYLYENFVIAADFDWRKKLITVDAIKKLSQLRLDGKLLFPHGSEAIIKKYLHEKVVPLSKIAEFYQAFGRPIEVITDRNLITEYKYGETLQERK